MKKRVIRIVMIGVFVLLLIGYGFGFCKINTQFKSAKQEKIPFGMEYEVGNGVQMKINKLSCMDKEEVNQAYGYKSDYEGEIKVFLVKVAYSNKSGDSQTVETYYSSIEKVGYSNGIDPILYSKCNSCDLTFELKSGEKKDVNLTYVLSDCQFTDREWKKISQEDFFVSTLRYPVKTIWLLK